MRTFGVVRDPTTGQNDINFTIVDGIVSLAQRLEQHLRHWRGTWFMDTTAGVDWEPTAFRRPFRPPLVQQQVTTAIQELGSEITGVDVDEFSHDANERATTYRATVGTIYGDMRVETEPGGERVIVIPLPEDRLDRL